MLKIIVSILLCLLCSKFSVVALKQTFQYNKAISNHKVLVNQNLKNYDGKKYFIHKTMLSETSIWMSSPGRGSSSGGGSTKIDRKTSQKTAIKPSFKEEIEKDWRLILHDDTVHTIQQVCDILTTCCPLCTGPRAYEVTLEVHMTGAGTVAVANKKIVDEYSKSLQSAGLTVSMSPDDEFEPSEEEES